MCRPRRLKWLLIMRRALPYLTVRLVGITRV